MEQRVFLVATPANPELIWDQLARHLGGHPTRILVTPGISAQAMADFLLKKIPHEHPARCTVESIPTHVRALFQNTRSHVIVVFEHGDLLRLAHYLETILMLRVPKDVLDVHQPYVIDLANKKVALLAA